MVQSPESFETESQGLVRIVLILRPIVFVGVLLTSEGREEHADQRLATIGKLVRQSHFRAYHEQKDPATRCMRVKSSRIVSMSQITIHFRHQNDKPLQLQGKLGEMEMYLYAGYRTAVNQLRPNTTMVKRKLASFAGWLGDTSCRSSRHPTIR